MLVPSILIFFTMALPCLMTFLSPSPVSSVKSSLYEILIEVSVSFSTKARTSTPTVESSKLQLTRESSVTCVFSSMESNNPSQLASSNPRPSRIRDVREGSLNLSSLMRSSISSSLIFFGCSVGCLDVILCLNVFDDTAAMAPRFHLLAALVGEDDCICGSGAELTLGCNFNSDSLDEEASECRSSYFAFISAIRRSFSWRPIDLSFIKD
mmetsp:Transcript_26993/g.41530  ORF Transcript_26993/g.41530 Transcript_26993/m.41530 type:complete len:210 (+) Transcript_26993:1119-1748(+)